MNNKGNSAEGDIDMDDNVPIDLKGSEQHHELKNQDGEQGDPDHASGEGSPSEKIEDAVKDAMADGDDDTAIGSALKEAVKASPQA